jgi:hypothetical protein
MDREAYIAVAGCWQVGCTAVATREKKGEEAAKN